MEHGVKDEGNFAQCTGKHHRDGIRTRRAASAKVLPLRNTNKIGKYRAFLMPQPLKLSTILFGTICVKNGYFWKSRNFIIFGVKKLKNGEGRWWLNAWIYNLEV